MICTLPITPKPSAKFQTFISPLLAAQLANHLRQPFCLATNLTGMRFAGKTDAEVHAVYDTYQGQIFRLLERTPEILWHDRKKTYQQYVIRTTTDLWERGLITNRFSEVLVCPCGAIEIETQHTIIGQEGKLYTWHGSTLVCKVCHEPALTRRCRSLYLSPSTEVSPPSGFPTWVQHEAPQLHDQVVNQWWRISRTTPRASTIDLGEDSYHLDTDFHWSLFLSVLAEETGVRSFTVVTAPRTLPKAIQVAALSSLINPEVKVGIVAHPLVYVKGTSSLADPQLGIEDFFNLVDSSMAARYFLAQGYSWSHGKERAIESRSLHTINHSLDPHYLSLPSRRWDGERSLVSFGKIVTQRQLQSLLAKLRRKQVLLPEELVLYQLMSEF